MKITGHHARTGVPFFRTSCMILGEAQLATFEAMLAITGRRPHQLIADLVLAAIQNGQKDLQVQRVEAWLKESRRGRDPVGLYIVKDSAS